MLYLILAILSSTLVSVFMRVGESRVTSQMRMFAVNYMACSLLSAAFMGLPQPASLRAWNLPLILGLGVVSGALYLISFLFMKQNIRHNGMVLTSTFMKLGVLIPTVMAVLVFRETLQPTQAAGILLSVMAIVLLHFEKEALQQGRKMSWLLALLLLSGVTDSMANIFEQQAGGVGKDLYLLVTFLAAFALAATFAVFSSRKLHRNDLLFGALIGVPNYFSSRFLLLALGQVQAVLVYPVYSVATLIAVSMVGVVVFREPLGRKRAAVLGVVVLALTLLNL